MANYEMFKKIVEHNARRDGREYSDQVIRSLFLWDHHDGLLAECDRLSIEQFTPHQLATFGFSAADNVTSSIISGDVKTRRQIIDCYIASLWGLVEESEK